MDFIGPILDILTRLYDCISKTANTVKDLKVNQEALQNALDQLKDVHEDVKRRVTLEEERQKERTNQVGTWLQKVEDCLTDQSLKDILEKTRQMTPMSCFCLHCPQPNACWSSYKLGQELKQKLKAVDDLKNEGKLFNSVAEALPRGVGDERPLEDTIGLTSPFEQVKTWIQDNQAKVIGIHGMGGVGKTMFLKKINNCFVRTNYGFDQVIWVVVSKPSTVGKVQDMICKQLQLPEDMWKDKSEHEKEAQIFKILSTKKFLLLLDDVWERVDLGRVGVPVNSENQRMSKVVFTTRYEDVCNYMESDEKIKIKCLAKEEALDLFKKKVGTRTLNAHPSIPKLSEIVVEECKGLPLALITMGRAMAGKTDPLDWDRAVIKLKTDASRITGMEDDVFRILKYSYDNLRNDTIKSCFTYCCIYPEDEEIMADELLDLWIGEGFLDEFNDVHEARDQGREIIECLKDASLLESFSIHSVKMHDVIRDMVVWISGGSKAKMNRYLVVDHVDVLKPYLVTSRVDAERVSFRGRSIMSASKVQSWPNTSTFMMIHNNEITRFPSGFFQFMHILKVLNLSNNMRLEVLPLSIGELVELEFLSVSWTRVRELPVELKNLTKMKYLLLDNTDKLEVIPRQVMSNFSLLRVIRLSRRNSASVEHTEHNILSGNRTALLELLEGLQHINDVSFTLLDSTFVEKLKNSHKTLDCLTSLNVQSLDWLEFSSSSVERMRHLRRFEMNSCELHRLIIHSEPDGRHGAAISRTPNYSVPRGCFHSLSSVNIVSCRKLVDLTWLVYAPRLEYLFVFNCPSMVEIVKEDSVEVAGVEEADLNTFSRLKEINLINSRRLQRVYPRPLAFPSLVEMHVRRCGSLRQLPFDSRSAQNLKKIEASVEWWDALQWEDEMLEPLFRRHYVPLQEKNQSYVPLTKIFEI